MRLSLPSDSLLPGDAAVMERTEVRDALLQRILIPYKDHCKYLKSARLLAVAADQDECVRIQGDFSIPESCYIASTGHFNSVEFNICYNQLVYVLLGHCIEQGLCPELGEFDLESYFRRQLPDILIVNFASTFKRPIHSPAFQAELVIRRFVRRGELMMIKTACWFYDGRGGRAEGEVTLAIVDTARQTAA